LYRRRRRRQQQLYSPPPGPYMHYHYPHQHPHLDRLYKQMQTTYNYEMFELIACLANTIKLLSGHASTYS